MLAIQLGSCIADNRVLDKSSFITWDSNTINCDVFHECSVMSPVFLLSYSSSIVGYNYVKVDLWNRYYYIIDATVAPGGRIYLTCQEDVLMSNKDVILQLTANIHRNEGIRNKMIVDNRYPAEIMSTLGIFNFDQNPFNLTSGYNLVMTVIGGEHA